MSLLPPFTAETSVLVDASPQAVWDLVSDVTRIGEFSPETFEAKWTHGATGPAVGARFAGHVKRNGVGPTYWSPCTVTACDPQRHFEFAVGPEAMAINNWGYRLSPEGAGTRLTEYFRLEANLGTRLYWLLFGRARTRTNVRGMDQTLTRMKTLLEEAR